MTPKDEVDTERRMLVARLVSELREVAEGHSIEDFHAAVANVVSLVAISQKNPDAVVLRMQTLLLHTYGAQREMAAAGETPSVVN